MRKWLRPMDDETPDEIVPTGTVDQLLIELAPKVTPVILPDLTETPPSGMNA